jgi:hypothetical protein
MSLAGHRVAPRSVRWTGRPISYAGQIGYWPALLIEGPSPNTKPLANKNECSMCKMLILAVWTAETTDRYWPNNCGNNMLRLYSYYWQKTSQVKASCKDSNKLQESWTWKTAKIFSRTRRVRPWSVWCPYKSEQTYSGHTFRVKLLLKVVVSLLENHKAAGLLFLRLTMHSG